MRVRPAHLGIRRGLLYFIGGGCVVVFAGILTNSSVLMQVGFWLMHPLALAYAVLWPNRPGRDALLIDGTRVRPIPVLACGVVGLVLVAIGLTGAWVLDPWLLIPARWWLFLAGGLLLAPVAVVVALVTSRDVPKDADGQR